jgi:hypothetical protein
MNTTFDAFSRKNYVALEMSSQKIKWPEKWGYLIQEYDTVSMISTKCSKKKNY